MYENFICTTENCTYYDEFSDCGCKKGAITIDEQRCADFEERESNENI